MDDEISGAPLPKARKVTTCTRMSLQDFCAFQLEDASCERVYIPPARRGQLSQDRTEEVFSCAAQYPKEQKQSENTRYL